MLDQDPYRTVAQQSKRRPQVHLFSFEVSTFAIAWGIVADAAFFSFQYLRGIILTLPQMILLGLLLIVFLAGVRFLYMGVRR